MTLTVADCASHIDQVLGGDLSSELTYTTLVNLAGEHLVQMHPWRWLERPQTWLAVRGNISVTGATTNLAGTTLTSAGAFANYDWLEGDHFKLTSGTGVTAKRYRITAATDDTLTLATSAGSSGTAIAGTVEADAVALPSDFVEIIAYDADNSLTNYLDFTSLQHLQDLRRREIQITSRHYFAALTKVTPVGGGTVVDRMEIYPSATANAEDEFVINYRAGWVTVSSDEDALTLATYCEHLYIQLLRAFAQGFEEYDEKSMQERLAMMQQSVEFLLARRKDGQGQPNMGPMRGGAASMSQARAQSYLRTAVQNPS